MGPAAVYPKAASGCDKLLVVSFATLLFEPQRFYDRHTSRHQRQKAENCRFTVKKVMIRISLGPSLYAFEPHLLLRTTV